MARILKTNLAVSELAAAISSTSALTFTLNTGDGAKFPNPGAGEQMKVQINDEIILCDSRSGDVFTVNTNGRGHEGTTAATHATSSTVTEVATAEDYQTRLAGYPVVTPHSSNTGYEALVVPADSWIGRLLARPGGAHDDDDEFDDGSVTGWTLVEAVTGGQTVTEDQGLLSIKLFESGSVWNVDDCSAYMKAIPSGTTTITIETAVRASTDAAGNDQVMFGPLFSDGTTSTSNLRWMMCFLGAAIADHPEVMLRRGTFTAATTSDGILNLHGIYDWLYLKSVLTTSTGVIAHHVSFDGVSWISVGSHTALSGITHMGLGWSLWADAPVDSRIVTFCYFRVTET